MQSSLIDYLRVAIRPEYVFEHTGSLYKLVEKGHLTKCKEITINKSSYKSIALKFDEKCSAIHPLLNSNISGLCICPDYLLFCELKEEQIVYIFLIELKSDNTKGWINQCISGKNIADYLVNMIELSNKNIQFKNREYRALLFYTKPNQRYNKKPLGPPKLTYQDHETGLKFSRNECGKSYELKNFCK